MMDPITQTNLFQQLPAFFQGIPDPLKFQGYTHVFECGEGW